MGKRLLRIGLVLIVSAGVSFSGCSKKDEPNAVEKSYRKPAAGTQKKQVEVQPKPAKMDNSTSTVKVRTAPESRGVSAGPPVQANVKPTSKITSGAGNENKINLDQVESATESKKLGEISSFTVKTPAATGGVRGVKK